MESRREILERELIHFASAGGLVLYAYRLLRWILPAWWFSPDQLAYLAALVVFVGSALREPGDIYHGQSLTKAIWDHTAWAAGSVLAAVAIASLT